MSGRSSWHFTLLPVALSTARSRFAGTDPLNTHWWTACGATLHRLASSDWLPTISIALVRAALSMDTNSTIKNCSRQGILAMQATRMPCNLPAMSMSDRIREAREAKGLSQSELARRLGVTPQTVQQWEAAGTGPKRSRLPDLGKELDVSPVWIEFGDTKPNNRLSHEALRVADIYDRLPPQLRKQARLFVQMQQSLSKDYQPGGRSMAKVAPFHSIKPNTSNVYHDNSLCTEGNNIEKQYHRSGTANRPRCDHCNRLAQQGR